MVATADPETMTTDQRRDEIANILARGLLRRVRAAQTGHSGPGQTVSEARRNELERPTASRLSVAPRPAR
jgi:hypothetical protein